MTLKEIVKGKNYPLIECRLLFTDATGDEQDVFAGYCAYQNEQLVSLDNDSYSLDDEYVKYKEFEMPNDTRLKNTEYPKGTICLTVWYEDYSCEN